MSLLFSAIGIAASEFFCPNLATISQTLRVSQSFAGVTFLALGNGAPDLFSTFAAMRVGSGSLAIGELVGSAFFITSAVAGSMAIVSPFKVSRKSFLRDAIFFSGAVAFSVALLAHGKVAMWETGGMIAYYIMYVIVVGIAAWKWSKNDIRRREEQGARDHCQRPDEERTVVEDDEETGLLGNVKVVERTGQDDMEMEQSYADLQHRMRLLRPTLDGTATPLHHNHSNIRPSLLGALQVMSKCTR